MLTAEKIIKTKHVKIFEDHFPGLAVLHRQEMEPVRDKIREVELSDAAVSSSEDEEDQGHLSPSQSASQTTVPIDQGALTYTPTRQSRFGEEDEDSDARQPQDSDNDEFESPPALHDVSDEDRDEVEPRSSVYGLRNTRRVDYAMAARTKIVDDNDQPTLSSALQSAHSEEWIQSIQEEFDVLQKNGTWT